MTTSTDTARAVIGAVRRLDDGTYAVPADAAEDLIGAYTRDARQRVLAGGFRVSEAIRDLAKLMREAAPPAPAPRSRGAGTITVAEAAARRGCSERHMRRLAAAGRIPARRSGGTWLIDASSVACPDSDL